MTAAEQAGARAVESLEADIVRRDCLLAKLHEDLLICQTALEGGRVAFDEAKLAFRLEQAVELADAVQLVLESAGQQAGIMSTQLLRISSLDVERMRNYNYYDRMEKAEWRGRKLKAKLDQLIVHKDVEELFRFGLGVLPTGAVLQKETGQVSCFELWGKKAVAERVYCSNIRPRQPV